ncbi:MAG TPA: DNA methyltransferase [Ignavibacteriaceae bacterium]|nr:DNA methyltransferase [Ignavibacteriaceae bacterium]
MKNKNRAPLNRTINLSKKEISGLKKSLYKLKHSITIKDAENKIFNNDLFKAENLFPSNFIDLHFVDPPYNFFKNFNQTSFRQMDFNRYKVWIDSWLSKMIRLLKPNASIYICGDWSSSSAIFEIGKKYFKVQNRIIWEREKGRGAKANWKNCTEDIWYFTRSDKFTFNIDAVKIKRKVLAPYKDKNGKPKDWKNDHNGNYRITYPSNIWTDISVPFWSMPENTDHPTQKPEKLLAKIILASSNPGDMVFDPFLGSGTTAVTAKKLGRKFCGVEKDEYFCCLTEKRLKLAEKNITIQGFNGGVFWERNTLAEQVKSKKSKTIS